MPSSMSNCVNTSTVYASMLIIFSSIIVQVCCMSTQYVSKLMRSDMSKFVITFIISASMLIHPQVGYTQVY